MESLEQQTDYWALLIGRFLLAFGDLELFSILLWRRCCPGEAIPHNFKERTRKVIAKLKKESPTPKGVVEALIAAMRLADKRNTVAHHPMCVQVFEHTSKDIMALEFAIRSEFSDEYITDQQLVGLTDETRQIVKDLRNAVWPNVWNKGEA